MKEPCAISSLVGEDGGSSSSLAEDNKFIEVLCKQYGSVRDCQCTGEAGSD